MDAKVIGEHIKEYRKNNNVSQRELAEQLFVSDKTISRWELGKGLPDIEQLPKIADILGISIDELVGSENAMTEADQVAVIDQYKEELKRREEEYAEKERQAALALANKKLKIKNLIALVGSVCAIILLCVALILALNKPRYTLTLVGVTTQEGETSLEVLENDLIPSLSLEGKTLLGIVDEENNFYHADDFRMPAKNTTLRALIKEEMPLFATSDGGAGGVRVAEHVLTEEGIPATKYVFTANSKKGTSMQSRPVYDSGDMPNINVYAPSLGKRLFLLSIENRSDLNVKIRYRVENFGDDVGGLDHYTEIELKANAITYAPVYFENNTRYGVFDGCDHFVILDQDINVDVELVIFGYIYTADELAEIEVVQAPNKFDYKEGEPIDLTGMQVEAVLTQGSITGRVKLINYACDLKGATWTAGMETLNVSFAGKTDSVVFYDPYEYKIAFTPAANLESINGTNGADYISAEYTSASDGMPATRFTLKAGATENMEVEAWINQAISVTKENGQNLRIPTFSGQKRALELIVTNEGGQPIKFYYYAENNGDGGGIIVEIAPGETKMVNFEVNPGKSIGCNYAFKLLNDVTEETTLTMHGYFYCRDELDGIEIWKEAECKTFTVGETFNREGLVIQALGEQYDDVIICNYTTNFDEYVFTATDIGMKTVTVYFDELFVTYDIEVVV